MNYQPFLNPRGGHKLRISLKLFQVSYNNSPSFCEKMVIPFFNRETLDGWKHLERKYCLNHLSFLWNGNPHNVAKP